MQCPVACAESRVPGNYNLTVETLSAQGLMSYLTVYAGQTLAVTGNGTVGTGTPARSVHSYPRLRSAAAQRCSHHQHGNAPTRGNLIDNTGRVVAEALVCQCHWLRINFLAVTWG